MARRRGEPPVERSAAAVAGRRRLLVLAAGGAGRTRQTQVEMVVVTPPRPHLAQPVALAPGLAAQRALDRRVDEEPRRAGQSRSGLDQLAVRRTPERRIDVVAIGPH